MLQSKQYKKWILGSLLVIKLALAFGVAFLSLSFLGKSEFELTPLLCLLSTLMLAVSLIVDSYFPPWVKHTRGIKTDKDNSREIKKF